MSTRNWLSVLKERWAKGYLLCVGLDTALDKIPPTVRGGCTPGEAIYYFNKAIIEHTADLVCAFKPQLAFYEAVGPAGMEALRATNLLLARNYPWVLRLADAKRGDVGNTSEAYAKALFDTYEFDATTLNPYLGSAALQPFLNRCDNGCIVLCRTSNPGAGEFQDLLVNGKPLYQVVAEKVAVGWNKNGNCGLVVGATYPYELKIVRQKVGDLPILIPGAGKAQGGDLRSVVGGLDSQGSGVIVNFSREVIYASRGPDFAAAARAVVLQRHEELRQHIAERSQTTAKEVLQTELL